MFFIDSKWQKSHETWLGSDGESTGADLDSFGEVHFVTHSRFSGDRDWGNTQTWSLQMYNDCPGWLRWFLYVAVEKIMTLPKQG